MGKTIQATYIVDKGSEALAQRTAGYILDRVQAAVASRGKARIAISGGNTPQRTFELLGSPHYRERMPWSQLELYWVDERCVPPDNPDSNYGMTKQALLDQAPLSASQIFRIHGELEPEKAAAEYETQIRKNFRLEGTEMPTFDLIALGMGPDGHTASLFPHTEALHEVLRISVANHVLSQKDTWRVTLTWPVINQAGDVFFQVQGKEKAARLNDVFLGPYLPEDLPSQLIQPRNGRLTLLLDEAAAEFLPKPDGDGKGTLEIHR